MKFTCHVVLLCFVFAPSVLSDDNQANTTTTSSDPQGPTTSPSNTIEVSSVNCSNPDYHNHTECSPLLAPIVDCSNSTENSTGCVTDITPVVDCDDPRNLNLTACENTTTPGTDVKINCSDPECTVTTQNPPTSKTNCSDGNCSNVEPTTPSSNQTVNCSDEANRNASECEGIICMNGTIAASEMCLMGVNVTVNCTEVLNLVDSSCLNYSIQNISCANNITIDVSQCNISSPNVSTSEQPPIVPTAEQPPIVSSSEQPTITSDSDQEPDVSASPGKTNVKLAFGICIPLLIVTIIAGVILYRRRCRKCQKANNYATLREESVVFGSLRNPTYDLEL